MRQRLGIARALVNDPVVLFMDEPVIGLDPRGQQALLDLVRSIAASRGAGIIVCSHSLSDVESSCDDVVILSSGRVVAAGPIGDVIAADQDGRARTAVLRISVPVASVEPATTSLRAMDLIDDVAPLTEGMLRVVARRTNGTDLPNAVLGRLIDADVPVLRFEVEGSSLADVFMRLTEEGAA
jgi:ABC-2 type transport system ATP-binding protein